MLGAVLLGGLVGEALGIEARLARLGDRIQARVVRDRDPSRPASTVSEAFFTASLLFCVGPLTVVGSFEDGLRGNIEPLATKSLLDGFASIALASTLGAGVAFAAVTVLARAGRADARRQPVRRPPARRGAQRDDVDRRRARSSGSR